jgi:hypothetical protein
MSQEMQNSHSSSSDIRSGSEIVSDFVADLKNDPKLDKATIDAIESLLLDQRLTRTNLLRLLEDERGKMSI